MNHLLKITSFLLFTLLFSISNVYSQSFQLSKNAIISVLTCESGTELYSTFGHTAIRVQNDSPQLDIVYNYGTFDFNTPNFYLKFIKGDLNYFATATTFLDFYYEYTLENRSIYEQQLLLNQSQKQELFNSLNQTLTPEKRYYTYKFIDKNCTTMVVDQLNALLATQPIILKKSVKQTYREQLAPYLATHFYESLGINIIFGIRVDELGEKLFLPKEFMQSLSVSKINQDYIAAPPIQLLQAVEKPHQQSWWNSVYTLIGVLVLLLLTRKNWVYLSVLTLFGVLGLFLLSVGFYSSHREVLYNYNTLLFNPLLLGIVYYFVKQNYNKLYILTLLNLVLLVFYTLFLLNKPHFLTFSILIGTSGCIVFHFLKISRTKKKEVQEN